MVRSAPHASPPSDASGMKATISINRVFSLCHMLDSSNPFVNTRHTSMAMEWTFVLTCLTKDISMKLEQTSCVLYVNMIENLDIVSLFAEL